MERLPQEILSSIIEMTEPYRRYRLQYVTVCRRWQRTIEPVLFETFYLEGDSDISTFATLFRPTELHRKALVKNVYLTITLPPYDGDDCHQHHQTNCQTFSDSIHRLFQVLETFNQDEGVRRGDGIHLNISSVKSPNDNFNGPEACRILSKYIQLFDHDKLPVLHCVSRFVAGKSLYSRLYSPVSTTYVASKLGDLKRCLLYYRGDIDYVGLETHKAIRSAFADALSTCTSSMEELLIAFHAAAPPNETTKPPNLIPASSQADPLNVEMHKLIQRAGISTVSFSAQHVISPEFFWPYGGVNVAPKTPFWPNLTRISMVLSPVTPGGDWYFIPDERIASYAEFAGENRHSHEHSTETDLPDSNVFRSIPNPETMNPLLIAMAHAIRHAPSLKHIGLRFSEILYPEFIDRKVVRAFDLYFKAAGVDSWHGTVGKPSVIWEVNDWRPDEDVQRHFKDALGPDGVMIYLDYDSL